MRKIYSLQSFAALIFAIILAGCAPAPEKDHLTQIQDRNTLVIGTLYSPTSYFSNNHTSSGMEYELAQNFAAQLGVELQVVANADLNRLFTLLNEGKIDILATGLSVTDNRIKHMRFGPPYYRVSQQLVYKQGKKRPRKYSDLTGNLTVMANSSHQETLLGLKDKYPALKWNTNNKLNPDQLLKEVIEERIDYTIVDSTVLARNRRLYPDLSLAMTIEQDTPIAWAISKFTDDSLYSEIISFFGEHQSDGDLIQLEEKYFGHVQRFDYVDTRAFIAAIGTKLKKYQILFELNQGQLQWEQLAALSYQESHWNPKAKSPTGVRGMMMLTLPTAKQMGVKSRLDAEQSIKGGAQYLQRQLDRLPESIPPEQRFWFALASYNVGFGHLMDARRLAVTKNLDPDSWTSIKQLLPLLEKPKYYKKSRYGYARGREAVHYVGNIRRYYETLKAMNITSVLAEPALEIAARIDSLKQKQINTPRIIKTQEAVIPDKTE